MIQGVLAAVFLFAGTSKLLMTPEQMQPPLGMPVAFLRFIGVAEIVGALGLVLPGIFRMARWLTSLAAAGLGLIMTGAVTVTWISGAFGPAVPPFVLGGLALTVAVARKPRGTPELADPLVA